MSFNATSCSVCDSLKIDPDFAIDKTGKEKVVISEYQNIRMQLRSVGLSGRRDQHYSPTFSILDTDRVIKNFALIIHQITDPAEQETCWAWGCVSYTWEFDFRDETVDDCLEFNLSVKPETFARYSRKIADGVVDEILFSVSAVAGFYSGWSPPISTDSVKGVN